MQLKHSRSYIITYTVNICVNFTYILTLNSLSHKSLSAYNKDMYSVLTTLCIWQLYLSNQVHQLQKNIYSRHRHDVLTRMLAGMLYGWTLFLEESILWWI